MQTADDSALLDLALNEAHLPSLLVAAAHLTGDDSLLRDDWLPAYRPFTDPNAGGLDAAKQAELRDLLRPIIPTLIGADRADFPVPDTARLKRLMNFVAGVDIPERYLPLLVDELGLGTPKDAATPAAHAGFKVLVIGAGMSGLLAGVKLKEAGFDFEIIERGGDVGGTWNFNTYPGCRVDSQNHLYCYSFHPNHDWPSRFSQQEALKGYFKGIADHYGLWDHIRFHTALDDASFDEASGLWTVRLAGPEGEETRTVNAVVSAVGQLNRPKIPEIKGQDGFAGPQMHSATWQHDVDLTGKNVAVVGTGASAFQLIPPVAKQAKHLTIFQRSAPWFSHTVDYHYPVGEGQKWLFKNLPFYSDWYRFWLFWTMTEGTMPALKLDPEWQANDGSLSAANQRLRGIVADKILEQIGDRTDLIDKVIPTSPFGGKRTLRDNGQWIETLKRDNVELVTEGIAEVTENAVVTRDGNSYPADVIVYGTGFHAARFLEPATIHGRDGRELNALWQGDPKAHLGMTVPGFPNFFMVYGPNTNLVSQGSIVFFSECSVHYIVEALKRLAADPGATMEPKDSAFDAYNDRVDAENVQMAWGLPGVTNWYKSESGRVSQNWPFPLAEYWDLTRQPDSNDFIIRHAQGETA